MITLHRLSDLSTILDLKALYLRSLIAPMDGMWDVGLTNPSPHWEIRVDGEQAGYYAANLEGALLQFYVLESFEQHRQRLFDHVVAQDTLIQAVVSTIDPAFLSLCLDVQKSVTVHTVMYELGAEVPAEHSMSEGLDFRPLTPDELGRTIAFQQACLGGDQDLSGWLSGYSANLIEREELFVLCRGDEWLGLGESRLSDTQQGVVDLGMMVAPTHRGEGWASYILSLLREGATARELRAICSTTVQNVAAQKAILRSGFIGRHRIMNVEL